MLCFRCTVDGLPYTCRPHYLKDIDEKAPAAWLELMKSASPSESFEGLSAEEKKAVADWRMKRGPLLQTRIQQEVEAMLEGEPSLEQQSTPFIRVLVKSYDISLFRKDDYRPSSRDEAILTIWSPTEEQLDLLEEGSVLRAENLSVRHAYEGRVQLAANSRTRFCLLPTSPSPNELSALGYWERKYATCFRIHVCSRQLLKSQNQSAVLEECDFIGIVLKVVEHSSGGNQKMSIYLTDKSNLVLRVQCGSLKGIDDHIGLRSPVAAESVEHPRVLTFRDIRVLPFDTLDNCAVAELLATSSIRSHKLEPRTDSLKQWAESEPGLACLKRLAAYMDTGLCVQQQPTATFVTAVGYISGFKVEASNQLHVLVDCATSHIQEWAFPFHLLRTFIPPESASGSVSLSPEEESMCSKLKILGKFLRARGVLLKFTLKRTRQSITHYSPCEFEVCQIGPMDSATMCGVYESLLLV